jgi:hypothetical protein
MRVVFSGQVPKDLSYAEGIEDSYDIRAAEGRVALSDGASESFDSRTWAHIITTKFVESPIMGALWLEKCVQLYAEQYDFQTLSWSKQASFSRGSFATLLGIECFADQKTVGVLAIGDSICAILENGNLAATFPYDRHEQFQQRPEILSTLSSHNGFVNEPDFYMKHFKVFPISIDIKTSILCMTDALGEWALRGHADGEPRWSLLMSLVNISELEELVLRERSAKRMRVDDVTLLHIDPLGGETDELSES